MTCIVGGISQNLQPSCVPLRQTRGFESLASSSTWVGGLAPKSLTWRRRLAGTGDRLCPPSPLAASKGRPELMHGLPRRLTGPNDLEVLVDEDVVRQFDADVVDVVLAVMVVPLVTPSI